MKRGILIISILFFVFFISCNKCKERTYAHFEFDKEILKWCPPNNEIINFESSDGRTETFKVSMNDTPSEGAGVDDTQCLDYTFDYYVIDYNSTLYGFSIKIWLSRLIENHTISFDYNNSTYEFILETLTPVNQNIDIVYQDSIILNNQTFKEILIAKFPFTETNKNDFVTQIYYSKEDGLVGYLQKDGVLWILKQT